MPDDVPADVHKAGTHWSQWIDSWAVDWDYAEDTFHNQRQAYHTRQARDLAAFPWSRPIYDAPQCVFNRVTCDNEFEREFTKFMQGASDVARKGPAVSYWVESASALTGTPWRYVKAPQREMLRLQPTAFADLLVFAPPTLPIVGELAGG